MRAIGALVGVGLSASFWAAPLASAQATPTIVTTATGSGPLGGLVGDTALLSGGSAETGTIIFTLYGPNDASCAGPVASMSMVTVTGDARYSSDLFGPVTPGTYRFIASYGGDPNNAAATTQCNDPGESVTLTPASPTIVTTATGSGPLGNHVTDTALLSGGFNESGTISFALFGPNDPSCARPAAFTSSAQVNSDGRYSSNPFTPSIPGAYQFVASYRGDANNAAATTRCGDAGESATIGVQTPTLTSTASASLVVGGQIRDTATLAGAGNPSGTITFRLFGPDDATCARGAIAVSSAPVSGSGSYVSDPFATTLPGVYRFVAGYSGDVSNGAASTACGDPATAVTVTNPPPPVLAQSFVVVPVSGQVAVKLPGAGSARSARASAKGIGFVALTAPRNLPIGSSVDLTSGSARLISALGSPGALQSGQFAAGLFKVLQNRSERGLTELDLAGPGPTRRACGKGAAAHAAARRPLSKHVLSLLRANVHGRFRTRGRYSSATVRGTNFDTVDRCDGTLTRVHRGVVVVRDFRRRRNIVLRAGKSYLAR